MKRAIVLLIALTAWLYPIKAVSAEIKPKTEAELTHVKTPDLVGLTEVKEPSNALSLQTSSVAEQPVKIQPKGESRIGNNRPAFSGRHITRAEKKVSVEALENYLAGKGSPLAPFAGQILTSPHWSTIIGICTIEQYGCTKAPGHNFWGIMCNGKVCRYASYEDGITAITNLLAKYESKGRDTLEELNGYYVQPASQNWYNTVLKTKQLVENL